MFREPNRWIRLLRTGPGQDSRPVAAGVIHMTSAEGWARSHVCDRARESDRFAYRTPELRRFTVMQDRVPLEDVRCAARVVVDYLIEDEEDYYRQNREDELEKPHAVLRSLRLLDQWLSEEFAVES